MVGLYPCLVFKTEGFASLLKLHLIKDLNEFKINGDVYGNLGV